MKNLLLKSVAFIALTSIAFTGCKKDDDDASPSITLNGDADVISSLNSSYTDAGATATDPEDGILVVTNDASSTNPNVNLAGDYTITYTATDSEGNKATAKRTVTVRNDAYDLAGSYITTENTDTWTQTLTPSTTKNDEFTLSRFANYDNNGSMTFKVTTSGTSRTVALAPPFQAVNGIGASSCNHEFLANGPGTPIATVAGKITFSIKFFDTILSTPGCQSTSAVEYEDFFVQN